MKIKLYQADAFTDKLFSGNPAAVCPLDEWLDDELMQKIAMENNLAETAFYVKKEDLYEIRWFTPVMEVDLCGHATLATAFVLFNFEGHTNDTIKLYSPRSGMLSAGRAGTDLTLNFPRDVMEKTDPPSELIMAFDIKPEEVWKGKTDFMMVYNNEDQIINIKVDLGKLAGFGGRGVIITAPGKHSDFVSRFFAPAAGINEDPVTGSAHTTLTPYWSARLGKPELEAIQLSARKGYLHCKLMNDRVEISGKAKLYLKGEIVLD